MADAPRSKFLTRLGRLLPSRLARRFVRRQDGAAAVEFALVAAPFLALTFAILETAFVFFAQQTLEATTADSARLVMTGQAQTANYTAADFKTLCHLAAPLAVCLALWTSTVSLSLSLSPVLASCVPPQSASLAPRLRVVSTVHLAARPASPRSLFSRPSMSLLMRSTTATMRSP